MYKHSNRNTHLTYTLSSEISQSTKRVIDIAVVGLLWKWLCWLEGSHHRHSLLHRHHAWHAHGLLGHAHGLLGHAHHRLLWYNNEYTDLILRFEELFLHIRLNNNLGTVHI